MDEEPQGSQGELGPMVYPDPVSEPQFVDGATFLYFTEELTLTTPPTPWFAGGGTDVLDKLYNERPGWGGRLHGVLQLWDKSSAEFLETATVLEPLSPYFAKAMIAVPVDQDALAPKPRTNHRGRI